MFRISKHKIALCLTLLLLVSGMSPAAFAAGGVEWAGTYSSPDNNTVVNYPLPTDTGVEQVWAAQVGNSPVVITDGSIYTCHATRESNGTLYKINQNNGEIVKQAVTGLTDDYQYSHIVYGGGLLYISVPTAIAAYDPDNLTQMWIYNRDAAKSSDFASVQYVNGFVVSNGIVLDATSGKLKKDLYTFGGGYNWANGAEVNGTYYVAAGSFIRAFDTNSWEQTSLLNTAVSGGSGAGVLHYNGRLYWADQLKGKLYSVALKEDGMLDGASLLTAGTGGRNAYTTPVAYGRRIYLACNTTEMSNHAGTASVLAFNAQTLALERTVDLPAGANGNKIQSTPILRPVTSGGAEIASIGTYGQAGLANTTTTTAYIYVQDYHTPGTVYLITDDGSQTEGEPVALITPAGEQAQYAFEQLACDADGAIYCNTNAGYLMKWQTIRPQEPVITENLSTAEVIYTAGEQAQELHIKASVTDGGTLSYQWYCHNGDFWFTEIEGANTESYRPSTTEAGTTYYKCEVTNTRGNKSAAKTSRIAKITVHAATTIPGDVDNSGQIDEKDVTRLIQYLAERAVAINVNNADVNGDNKIDLIDLVRLRRHVVLGNSL